MGTETLVLRSSLEHGIVPKKHRAGAVFGP